MATLPPNSVALLRICTEKSRLGFGKYDDLTVGDILKVDEVYIAYVYYNIPKVSFKQDILDRLAITPIAKPGKDQKAWWAWKDAYELRFTEEQRSHGRMRLAQVRKAVAKAKAARVARATYCSKATLQAINHGHIDIKNKA